jgi:hypothetical protein
MKIRDIGNSSCRLAFLLGLFSLLFLLLISGTNAQNYPARPASEKEIRIAANRAQKAKSPEEMSSKEWAAFLRKIDRLERTVAKLESQNDFLRKELSNLNSLCKQAKTRGAGIQKTVRTGSRPDKNDTMISVAGMLSVWDQMDIIMDKLDEIVAVLSD